MPESSSPSSSRSLPSRWTRAKLLAKRGFHAFVNYLLSFALQFSKVRYPSVSIVISITLKLLVFFVFAGAFLYGYETLAQLFLKLIKVIER